MNARPLLLLALLLPSGTASATPAESAPPGPATTTLEWLDLTPGVIRRALAEDRLILLLLDVPWSEAVKVADEALWSDPEVIAAVKSGYLPVRVRADVRPDLRARFPAEGWPGINLLLPDASPMFFAPPEGETEPRRMTATLLPPEKMAGLLREARLYYEIEGPRVRELSRKETEKIRETARPSPEKLDETMVLGIATQLQSTFDPEARYFGGPPRLPRFDLIEFMGYVGAELGEPWRTMGGASLDTLAAKLTDPEDGALYRLALGLDWEDPQKEKLLDRNARLLELQALAFRLTGRRSYRDQALRTGSFLTARLGNADGSFAAAVCAPCPGGRDEAVLAGANAAAAAALIRAGAALGEGALVERGLAGARFLRDTRWRAGRGVARAVIGGEGLLTLSLEDLAETAWAFLAAYEATGDRTWLDAAADIARTGVANLRDPKTGALADSLVDPAAPGLLGVPLYPIEANSQMVRVLVRLFWLTGERRYADAAREVLRSFADSYRRVPLLMPSYALAAYEYHYPPIRVVVTGRADDPAAAALRHAALGSAFPFVTVLTLDPQRDRERILGAGLAISPAAGLTGYHGTLSTERLVDPGAVRGALAELREQFIAAKSKPAPAPKKAPISGRPGIPR